MLCPADIVFAEFYSTFFLPP